MRNSVHSKNERLSLFSNKKANAIQDTLLLVVFLGVFIFVIIFTKQFVSTLAGEITTEKGWGSNASAIVQDMDDDYGDLWDGIFLFVFCGLWITAIIFAFLLDAHPIFYVISIIGIIGVFLVAGDLSNTYNDIVSTDADVQDVATTSFPIANGLLENWLMVAVIIAFSIIIVLYMKNRLSG